MPFRIWLPILRAQVVLYSFPAVCWVYGAGWVFSTFVSVVFWGASLQQAWEALRRRSTIVRPMGLQVRSYAKGHLPCQLNGHAL